jgi:protein-tyrosine phosphatase
MNADELRRVPLSLDGFPPRRLAENRIIVTARGERQKVAAVKELYWVIPKVLGGRCGPGLTPWELSAFREAGIGGVVSLDSTDVNVEALAEAGIEHLAAYLPMILLLEEGDREAFLEALPPIFRFIDRIRRRRSATLVHCYYGLDRTGALLASYLIARERFHAAKAIEHVRQLRPQAMLAPGYTDAVHLFEKKQRVRVKRSPARRSPKRR